MSHHLQKHRLLSRLRELGGRLDDISEALAAPRSKDWEEMATEREDDEVLERLEESGEAEIRSIRDALMRMTKGEYGTCVRCGGEIAAARLESVPQTPLCVSCAAG